MIGLQLDGMSSTSTRPHADSFGARRGHGPSPQGGLIGAISALELSFTFAYMSWLWIVVGLLDAHLDGGNRHQLGGAVRP